MLIKAALVDGDPDVGVLPTGQVTGLIDSLPPVAEIIATMVADARTTLARLASDI
jgi:NAD(P)H-dependent flavin oxidoreductase YrpB (nitropropane dioxygenase family)